MIGFEGVGGFADASLRHNPDLFRKTQMFAAVSVKGCPETARVLEGRVPSWRLFGPSVERDLGNGANGKKYGLPRFGRAEFTARFPFATVSLSDPKMPLTADITAWTPFIPNDTDNSSLPVTAIEYTLTNTSDDPFEAVFSFHAESIMRLEKSTAACGVDRAEGGFRLWQDGAEEEPWDQGEMIVAVDSDAFVDHCWFRGWVFDSITMLWEDIRNCTIRQRPPVTEDKRSPASGSIYVPFALKPGESSTVRVRMSWFVPYSGVHYGREAAEVTCEGPCCCTGKSVADDKYRPWYSTRFKNVSEVDTYWRHNSNELRRQTSQFSDALFDTTLPPEVLEAVTANLSIMLSPTVLRLETGELWGWEGCNDVGGCCPGSCTHVWNYAQAFPHLFPEFERSLRDTEFNICQDERGHQAFRSHLPLGQIKDHSFHAASDGRSEELSKSIASGG